MTTIYLNHNLGLLVTDSRATTTVTEYSMLSLMLPRFFNPKVKVISNSVVPSKSLWIHDALFTASGDVQQVDAYLNHLLLGKELELEKRSAFNFNALLIGRSWVKCIDVLDGKLSSEFYCVGQNGRFNASLGSGSPHIKHLVHGDKKVSCNDMTEEYILEEFAKCAVKDPYSDDNLNIFRFK